MIGAPGAGASSGDALGVESGTVSIVMASYDRAATLPRAIDSVLAQDYARWELIVVDDGSRDDTAEELARYDDPRLIVVRHAENRGVTAAKNTGLDHVRGEWFTFVDSDDEIVSDGLSAMLAVAAEHPDVTAVTCNCVSSLTGAFSGGGLTGDGYIDLAALARATGQHWGITKTSLLGRLRFDERIPGMEGALWLKISVRARRYYLDRGLKIYHEEGADRISHQNADFSRRALMMLHLSEDEEYLRALRAADPEGLREQLFMMTLANVRAGRRRRAWRLFRRFSGSPAREVLLLSACLLGPRWVGVLFAVRRRRDASPGR